MPTGASVSRLHGSAAPRARRPGASGKGAAKAINGRFASGAASRGGMGSTMPVFACRAETGSAGMAGPTRAVTEQEGMPQ